jgi:hypothetical protein
MLERRQILAGVATTAIAGDYSGRAAGGGIDQA